MILVKFVKDTQNILTPTLIGAIVPMIVDTQKRKKKKKLKTKKGNKYAFCTYY